MRASPCSRCVCRVYRGVGQKWGLEGWGGCKARIGVEVVHASSPKVEFNFLSPTRAHSQHRTAEVSQLCSQLGPPEMMLQWGSSWGSCRTQQSSSSAAALSLSLFMFGLQGERNSSTHTVGRQMHGGDSWGFSQGFIHTKGSGNKVLNGPNCLWLNNYHL